jgi:hypothetical protein
MTRIIPPLVHEMMNEASSSAGSKKAVRGSNLPLVIVNMGQHT